MDVYNIHGSYEQTLKDPLIFIVVFVF